MKFDQSGLEGIDLYEAAKDQCPGTGNLCKATKDFTVTWILNGPNFNVESGKYPNFAGGYDGKDEIVL